MTQMTFEHVCIITLQYDDGDQDERRLKYLGCWMMLQKVLHILYAYNIYKTYIKYIQNSDQIHLGHL